MTQPTWEDRLRPGAYTAPQSGTRIRFDFEDLSRDTPLRNASFSFPNINNDYIQQNGFGSRVYPMRCIFWGGQCDLVAASFEAALLEKGLGRLEHPMHGTIDVVPTGSIARRDDLKTAANQAIVEITFSTTTGVVYPSTADDPQNEIKALIAGFDVAAAQRFMNGVNVKKAAHRAALKGGIRGALAQISKALTGVSSGVSSVNREFRKIQSTVNYGLDVLVGQPLLLAQQISDLIKAPSRALSGIQSRLDGYGDLASEVFGSSGGRPLYALARGAGIASRTTRVINDYHVADLVASNSVAGSIQSVSGPGQFQTRPEAIGASLTILGQFDEWVGWREENFSGLQSIPGVDVTRTDDGETYQLLQLAAAKAAGSLISLSFSLKPQREIWIDRPRTIIDLASELYKSVDDDRLDFLINTNNLTGDEIMEVGRGRRIVYYA